MSKKSRSKDDTWTTEELDRALRNTDDNRHARNRTNDSMKRREREHRVRKEELVDDEYAKMTKDDEERERQRQDRRRRREEKDKSKSKDERRDRNKVKTTHRDLDEDDNRKLSVKLDRENEYDVRRKSNRRADTEFEDENGHRKHRQRSTQENGRPNDERTKSHRSYRDPGEEKRRDHHRSNKDVTEERWKSSQRSGKQTDRNGRKEHQKSERDYNDKKRNSKAGPETDYNRERESQPRGRSKNDNDRKERHQSRREKPSIQKKHQKDEYENQDTNKSHFQESIENEPDDEENAEYNYEDDDFENYEEDFEEDDDDNSETEDSPKNKEMDDILRALHEENQSLIHGSVGSVESVIKNRKEDQLDISKHKNQDKGRTFINFVSAKNRAVNQKLSNKTRKRYKDLVSLIEFDKTEFVMFDLPPVKEYDLYIRNFGRSDSKQAYVQTNEDDIEREVQTEEIEYQEKWTQHPAEDSYACGGENIDQSKNAKSDYISKHQIEKMGEFVSRAAQVIGILLDEESGSSISDGSNSHIDSELSISADYVLLGSPPFLKGRYVEFATFSSSQPNILLTSFSCPEKIENVCDTKGIVCMWNLLEPSNPQKILACESQPTCCCLSPNKPLLACAGMVDGSIVVWDLREEVSMHHTISIQQEEYIFRYPTYNTAGVSEIENHLSPVSTVLPVYLDATSVKYEEENKNESSGLSFQLASCAENGSVNLWVVAEMTTSDFSGSEVDLGLHPGGRIKVVKSSSFLLQVPSDNDSVHQTSAYDFRFSPQDLNQYYVGTDIGLVIHGVRLGTCPFPRVHKNMIGRPVRMKSIDLSPFGYPFMLVGSCDGHVYLFHTGAELPIISWSDLAKGKSNSISFVRWSRSRPGVFFVLDDMSYLYTFDLLEGDFHPIKSEQIKNGQVKYMTLGNDSKIVYSGTAERPPQLLLAFQNGKTEIHNLRKHLVEQQTLEHEFLMKYNERF